MNKQDDQKGQSMDCILQLIKSYPFSVSEQPNFFTLTYTLLASRSTCTKLSIQHHKFQVLQIDHHQILVLVVLDQRIQEDVGEEQSEVMQLFAPYNIITKLKNHQHSKRAVKIRRTCQKLLNPTTPSLQIVNNINIYLNNNSPYDDFIKSMLKTDYFILKTGFYYFDVEWLSQIANKCQNIKNKIQLKKIIAQNEGKDFTNYFKIYIEIVSDEGQIKQIKNEKKQIMNENKQITNENMLFEQSKTQVKIIRQKHHPKDIIQRINLDPFYNKIYQSFQKYTTLQRKLLSLHNTNQMILLQTEANIGINQLIHFTMNTLNINCLTINCEEFPSERQFYAKIENIFHQDSSFVVIENVAWIEELCRSENVENVELKHILQKIENIYQENSVRCFRKYTICITHPTNQSIQSDVFKNCTKVVCLLEKEEKIQILNRIINQVDDACSQELKREMINVISNKIGWTRFYKFMKKNWKIMSEKSWREIIKEMQKLIRQQKVQNIADVSWDDVGGLQTAKEEIIQTILLPIRHPEIFDQYIRPRTGLLFYGPPGTGKTLLGKCIAKECKMGFISVKGPELLNMYVGESQKNVREVFQRAAQSKPCIVFMDELDALIPKRGNSGDSNQVMDRIVAQLLMQMDIASLNQVFVIGATNRPDLLDPSILRPGRFDKQIYLGISKNQEDRVKILKAQTKNLKLIENFDYESIVEKVPMNFTGADFYGLTSKAVMIAAERTIVEYEKDYEIKEVIVKQQDFYNTMSVIKPSVTEQELQKYEDLKKIYS